MRAVQAGNTATAIELSFCVLSVKPVITSLGNILISSNASGNQWYLNGEPMSGAIAPTYQPAVLSNYMTAATLRAHKSAAGAGLQRGHQKQGEPSDHVWDSAEAFFTTIDLLQCPILADFINSYHISFTDTDS